jgi:histone H3/H4
MAEVHRDNVRASASTSSGLLDPVPPPVLQEQTAMDISPSKKADGYSSSSSKSTKLKDSRSGHRSKQLHFPLSRVRTIMKCAPDISNINQECVYVMTRATELFVEEFSRVACNQAAKSGRIYINYDDLGKSITRIYVYRRFVFL